MTHRASRVDRVNKCIEALCGRRDERAQEALAEAKTLLDEPAPDEKLLSYRRLRNLEKLIDSMGVRRHA